MVDQSALDDATAKLELAEKTISGLAMETQRLKNLLEKSRSELAECVRDEVEYRYEIRKLRAEIDTLRKQKLTEE